MERSLLKGGLGDSKYAMLCACGYKNLRLLVCDLPDLFIKVWAAQLLADQPEASVAIDGKRSIGDSSH